MRIEGESRIMDVFWGAIFALKESPELSANLKECIWYNGSVKENLITGFLRN